MLQNDQKEEVAYFKQCQKLGGVKYNDVYMSPTKAATYLHLRDHCSKEAAMRFARRRICKWDRTIQKDGPHNCRILKPHFDYREKNINGWQNVGVELYYSNPETIADIKLLDLDPANDIIQREFEKNERLLKNDFKSKIATLQNFYAELNKKYKMDPKNPDFKNLITKSKVQLQESRYRPIRYAKVDGTKFIEIVQDQKDQQNGIIDQFHAFGANQLRNMHIKSKLPDKVYKTHKRSGTQVYNQNVVSNIEFQSQAALDLIESTDNAWGKNVKSKSNTGISSKAFLFADDYNKCKYFPFEKKKSAMSRISEIPELSSVPSARSIKFSKSKFVPEKDFDSQLQDYLHSQISKQDSRQDTYVDKSQFEKLMEVFLDIILIQQKNKQDRQRLVQTEMKRMTRKNNTLHVPQLNLERISIPICYINSVRDSSTQSNTISNKRSYLVTPKSQR